MDEKQQRTPFFDALVAYEKKQPTSFDVPGHKLGRIPNELADYCGEALFRLDANAPRGLDNLQKPTGVIKEAQELMAECFQADQAYFLTGGTTLGILSMIMATVPAKCKIILPRNVHKSVINALVLSGAIPIFVSPEFDLELGIANAIDYNSLEKAVAQNPDAHAIFVINPTYYGSVCDLRKVVKLAHDSNMLVLVDEAHGGNLYFEENMPLGAMEAGADIAAISIHKTLGSLTQSSVLLTKGPRVDHQVLSSTINMLTSTSPSHLLMASLDTTRKSIYFNAPKLLPNLIKMISETRNRLNKIEGIKAYGPKYFGSKGSFSYDPTKLVIDVRGLGVNGFEILKELSDKYLIQMELAETNLVLAVLSIGTRQEDLDHLVNSLEEIAKDHIKEGLTPLSAKFDIIYPKYFIRPREAYHAPKKYVAIENALGEISAEQIMIYPPGIPLIIQGEIISQEVIDMIINYQNSGSVILSDTFNGYTKVVDKENWAKWEEYRSEYEKTKI